MTIIKQEPQKASGSSTGQSKSLKKRKVVKTCPEKCPEMKKPTEVPVTKEVEEVEETVERAETADVSDQQTPTPENGSVNGSGKAPQLEKRKQEGSEWKTLKKIDYQRLETVLEEVQSSGEAASSKMNVESGKSSADSEQVPRDVGSYGRLKRPWFYNLVSITEHPELLSGDETQSEEDEEKQQIIKNQQHVERCNKLDSTEGHGEPAEKIPKEVSGKFNTDKRSVILNGMVEILPIFSNDKFVCSRDAISIEECEELDNLEKTLPSSGKFIIDSKTSKDSRTVDIKPFHSTNSVKKGFRDRLTEKLQNFREAVGAKLHRPQQSMFTENIARHSSHFINFLLVLTPFAEERQKLLQEKKLADSDGIACKGSNPLEERRMVGIEGHVILRVVYGLILTTVGVMSIVLGIAWKSYKPPGVLDIFLSFIPFTHPRRTYLQIVYDKFIKFLAAVFGIVNS